MATRKRIPVYTFDVPRRFVIEFGVRISHEDCSGDESCHYCQQAPHATDVVESAFTEPLEPGEIRRVIIELRENPRSHKEIPRLHDSNRKKRAS